MNREQMIAWLTIEGWIAYAETRTDLAAAQNGINQIVVDTMGDKYQHFTTTYGGQWDHDDVTVWVDMPPAMMEFMYQIIQEHNL